MAGDSLSGSLGVFAAAVTPRRPGHPEPDIGAALQVIDFLCNSKVRGIALFGATGEYPHFSLEHRTHLAGLAIKRSRLPVLVNVSHSTLDGALRLADEAAAAGASGFMIAPPHYYTYQQAEVRQFLLDFGSECSGTLPVFLYNIPFFTSEISSATASDLLSSGYFAGIKDSSGSWEYFQVLKKLQETAPFTMLVGNDVLFTEARQGGADGIISGVACAVPELLLGLERAICEGAKQKTARLEARLVEFIEWLDAFPAPVGIKLALSARGIPGGLPACPPAEATKETLAAFERWFIKWLPEMRAEVQTA